MIAYIRVESSINIDVRNFKISFGTFSENESVGSEMFIHRKYINNLRLIFNKYQKISKDAYTRCQSTNA